MKKILLLATGGTIASVHGEKGLVPKLSVEEIMGYMPHIRGKCELHGTMVMNIDSTNMNPSHWQLIADAIKIHYMAYDGFVVTHGTDTMAYTSAALTYMIDGLNKPVIVTGSQYPIAHTHSDAAQNINDAIMFAMETLKGVMVVFDGKLIAGTRAKKMKTRSYDAFDSINFPYLAEIKYNKIVYQPIAELFSKQNIPDQLPLINHQYEDRLLVLKLFPGMHPDILDYLSNHYKGIIIESFGMGGIPNDQIKMAEKIKELLIKGIHVAVTTQCIEEGMDMTVYEVGKLLANESIIYSKDMNVEALVAKMILGMPKYPTIQGLKQFIETPFYGDIED